MPEAHLSGKPLVHIAFEGPFRILRSEKQYSRPKQFFPCGGFLSNLDFMFPHLHYSSNFDKSLMKCIPSVERVPHIRN